MILITGASGQLGQALTALCQRRGIACRAYSRQQLDICNQARVKACFDLESFDCVINCAAYTAVDAAENDPQTAFAVNAEGPRILAESGVPVIQPIMSLTGKKLRHTALTPPSILSRSTATASAPAKPRFSLAAFRA